MQIFDYSVLGILTGRTGGAGAKTCASAGSKLGWLSGTGSDQLGRPSSLK
jgi:hypothetical protein